MLILEDNKRTFIGAKYRLRMQVNDPPVHLLFQFTLPYVIIVRLYQVT